jgi:acetyl-CoA carboxylase biotin carboxyl carrier protein
MAVVKAPMVGTFYRAPSPGAKPFVEVGDKVAPDSVVCIIDVMKLMNTIHAGASGTVREIRVENSQPVEFGQVLLVIEPHR